MALPNVPLSLVTRCPHSGKDMKCEVAIDIQNLGYSNNVSPEHHSRYDHMMHMHMDPCPPHNLRVGFCIGEEVHS